MRGSTRCALKRTSAGSAGSPRCAPPTSPRWPPTTGPLQMSLFDQANLAEITHPDYPGERLVACRNPALADERARKRAALLAATDTDLGKVVAAVAAGRLVDPDKIGIRVGKVIDRRKMGKHYLLDIPATTSPTPTTRPASTPKPPSTASTCCAPACPPTPCPRRRRARLQEPRPRRTRLRQPQDHRPGPAAHPPLHRRPGPRPRLALRAGRLPGLAPAPRPGPAHLHRRNPPTGADPVAPARRSAAADRKASRQTRRRRPPVYSFRGLRGAEGVA